MLLSQSKLLDSKKSLILVKLGHYWYPNIPPQPPALLISLKKNPQPRLQKLHTVLKMADHLKHNYENISVALSQFSLSSVSKELFTIPSNPTFFYLITKFSFRIVQKDTACISNVLSLYSDLDEVGGEEKNPLQNNKKTCPPGRHTVLLQHGKGLPQEKYTSWFKHLLFLFSQSTSGARKNTIAAYSQISGCFY